MLAIVAAAAMLRAAIPFSTGQPFSTDVWPLIRDTMLVVSMDVDVFNDTVLDGYHNRWPAVILSASMASLVAGVEPSTVFMYLSTVPVLAAGILFYSLARREEGVESLAYFLLAPPLLVFTIPLLKEVYGLPLLALYLYALLGQGASRAAQAVLLGLVSAAIALSHPLVALVAVETSLFLALPGTGGTGFDSRALLASLLLALVVGSYNYFMAPLGVRSLVLGADLASYTLYGVFAYLSIILLRGSKAKLAGLFLGALAVLVFLLTPLNPSGKGLGWSSLLYFAGAAAPIAAAVLARRVSGRAVRAFAATVSWNVLYSVIGNPVYSGIAHRFADYVVPLNTFIVSRLTRRAAVVVVAVAAISSTIIVAALLAGQDRAAFYWVYREDYVVSASLVASHLPRDAAVLGDEKAKYLFEYLGRRVDSYGLVKLLYRGPSSLNSCMVFYAPENLVHGFVVALVLHQARPWLSVEKGSLLYDSGATLFYDCSRRAG